MFASNPAVSKLSPKDAHQGSVVGVLLSDSDMGVRRWGIELLLQILKLQDSAEFILQLDAFVPMVCKLATTALSPLTDGADLANVVSATALQALLEHLRLCSRISYAARHLDVITDAVLSIIDNEGEAAVEAYEVSKTMDISTPMQMSRFSIGARIGASTPCQAAVLIYKELGTFTQDKVEGRNVAGYWLEFMERKPSRWQGGAALDVGLGVLRDCCTQDHQQYMLASVLLRHAATSRNGTDSNRIAVMSQAVQQISYLGPTSTAALLLLAIELMSDAFSDTEIMQLKSNPPSAWLSKVHDAVGTMAKKTGSRFQVSSAIEVALGNFDPGSNSRSKLCLLYLCEAAAGAYLEIPQEPAQDCNVTESMVHSISNLSRNNDEDEALMVITMMKGLHIMKLTFEATYPGSVTSARCVRAIASLIGQALYTKCTTPDILVNIQGVFRAMTETSLQLEGKRIACGIAAALSQIISRHLQDSAATSILEASKMLAAAFILSGMWESLSSMLVNSSLTELKPKHLERLSGDASSNSLYLNSIGMAMVQPSIDPALPFSRQPSINPDSLSGITFPSEDDTLRAISEALDGTSMEDMRGVVDRILVCWSTSAEVPGQLPPPQQLITMLSRAEDDIVNNKEVFQQKEDHKVHASQARDITPVKGVFSPGSHAFEENRAELDNIDNVLRMIQQRLSQ